MRPLRHLDDRIFPPIIHQPSQSISPFLGLVKNFSNRLSLSYLHVVECHERSYAAK